MASTEGQEILLKAEDQLVLQDFTDSDWGACKDTRRSISGYVMQLGKFPIRWNQRSKE